MPSGGDDGPAMVAMAERTGGRVVLGPGDFKILSPIYFGGIVQLGTNYPRSLTIEGAGMDVTRILCPDTVDSTLGTWPRNWLTAKPMVRIAWSALGVTLRGFTLLRTQGASTNRAATHSGLGVLFDPLPTEPWVLNGYYPQELVALDQVRIEGFSAGVACNDVTSFMLNRTHIAQCDYALVSGFNCDVFKAQGARFGTAMIAVDPGNAPMSICLNNGYAGRGQENFSFTIAGGIGSVTATNSFAVGDQFYAVTVGTSGTNPMPPRVITVLSATAGAFTFEATGYDGAGTIDMGGHASYGGGNQWLFDSCWNMGIKRIFEDSDPGTTGAILPSNVKLLNCYFEQTGILLDAQTSLAMELDSCYFVGKDWPYISTYIPGDASKQTRGVFNFVSAGANTPPSRIKFRSCFGVTFTDGWVYHDGGEQIDSRTAYTEFDDCNFSFNDSARSSKHYHISSIAAGSAFINSARLTMQYQAAINTQLSRFMEGIGLHRYRGLVRLSSSDDQVYAASSNAASNVTAIPATLTVRPPEADVYVLDGIDKAVLIDKPKVRRFDAVTYDDYTTSYMVVAATTRSKISSLGTKRLRFLLKEDATAGHVISWDALYKFHTPFVQSVAATDANKTTLVEFEWDGANWVQVTPTNRWI